ncbi:MAG TPA: hypothetical protein VII69_13145 [Candidatus Eremiobacteraceae bacterium]
MTAIVRGRFCALTFALAVALAGGLSVASCSAHDSSDSHLASIAGLPVYPNASMVGASSGALAIYRSADPYLVVADWYGTHMPKGTHTARNDAMSQATFAIFLPEETKTVHVEMSDGTVRITLTDVKNGPASSTGR